MAKSLNSGRASGKSSNNSKVLKRACRILDASKPLMGTGPRKPLAVKRNNSKKG